MNPVLRELQRQLNDIAKQLDALQRAEMPDVVRTSGAQSVGGVKTFTDDVAVTTIRAADANGLTIEDDGGNVALTLVDGGFGTLNSLRTNQVSINDDAVHSFTPRVPQGVLAAIPASVAGQSALFALVYFRVTTGSLDCVSLLQTGTSVSVGTTELTAGTSDGVDGNLNVHAYNEQIYIKNRRGGTRIYSYLVLG